MTARDPLQGLRYSLGVEPMSKLIMFHRRRRGPCQFAPHGNPKRHPMCVKCGKAKAAHG